MANKKQTITILLLFCLMFLSISLAYGEPVAIMNDDGKVCSLYSHNGSEKWCTSLSGSYANTVELDIDSEGNIYAGWEDLYKIKPNGTVEWTFTNYTGTNHPYSLEVSPDDYVYVGTGAGSGNKLYKFDQDGNLIWVYQSISNINGIAFDSNQNIYISTNDNVVTVEKLDPSQGTIDSNKNLNGANVWNYSAGGSGREIAVDTNDYIYLAERDENIHKLDEDGNKIWESSNLDYYIVAVDVDKNNLIYTGRSVGNITTLYDNGTIKNDYQSFSYATSDLDADNNGSLYGCTDSNRQIKKIDADTNTQLWSYQISSSTNDKVACSAYKVEPTVTFGDAQAEQVDYAYSTNQYGNTNYIEGNESLNFTQYTNVTYCQPFVAPLTGTINEFYIDGKNNGAVFQWIFSDSKERFHSNDVNNCYPSCNLGSQWLNTDGESVQFNVTKGQTYYLCTGVVNQENKNATMFVSPTNETPNSDTKNHFDVTTHYNMLVGDVTQTDYKLQRNYMSGGSFQGWEEIDYMFNDFQYCYGAEGEQCFQLSNHNYDRYKYGSSLGVVGEAFRYKLNDGRVDKLNMMVAKGNNTNNSAVFRVKLYDFDTNDNSLSEIYSSGDISASVINNTVNQGFELLQHKVDEIVYLFQGEWYVIGIDCIAGCGVNKDEKIYVANTKSKKNNNEWFHAGFGNDVDAYLYNDDESQDIVETADAWFRIDFTEDVWSLDDSEEEFVSGANCTDWELPYYLKENFKGCIFECGWVMSENECYNGFFRRKVDDDYFTMYTQHDLAKVKNNRYYSINFDIKPQDYGDPVGGLVLSSYDDNGQRLVTVSFRENNTILTENDGNQNIRGSSVLNKSVPVSIHIDLVSDDYDLYYNGTKIGEGLSYYDDVYNADNIQTLRITNSKAKITMKNLEVVATDRYNNVAIPDEETVEQDDPNRAYCDLFYLKEQTCSNDADCLTGVCSASGTCSKFDYTYCDKNGYTRGNKCIFIGLFLCFLTSVKNMIFNNFLLFIVFLMVLVMLIYFMTLMRK